MQSRRALRTEAAVLTWLVAGISLGVLVDIISAVPASAACSFTELLTRVQFVANGRGIKSGNMKVFDTAVDCARLSSVFDENDTSTRRAEMGWYEDPADVYFCVPPTSGTPQLYAAAWDAPYWHCLPNPSTVQAGTYSFAVHDKNQDGVWTFLYEGGSVYSYDLQSFVTGFLYDSGERVSTLDVARSNFNANKRMGTAGWEDPSGAAEAGSHYSNDPDFRPCIYTNGTHTTVVSNGTWCYPEPAARRAEMRHLRIHKALGPLVFAVAFAAAATVTSLAGDEVTSSEMGTGALRVRDPMSLFDPAVPLMLQGFETTLAQAPVLVGYGIYRPTTLGEPSQVWVSTDTREVGLRYTEAGLVILLAPWPVGKDAQASLAASVQDLPLAYTTTIGGDPAAVLPYDPDRAIAPLDVVHVVVDGVEVSVYGVHATAGLEGVLAAATEAAGA